MFEQLSERILGSIKKLTGQTRIAEESIQDAVKEIRLALLEADVNFKVVKSFTDRVREKAVGAELIKGVQPGQQFMKIVHDELVHALGRESVDLDVRAKPAVIYLVGLQGAGKTTSAAKLAIYIQKKFGKKVGLVPADVYRPAAIDQLRLLGERNQIAVYHSQVSDRPESILKGAQTWTAQNGIEVAIVDTAGRTQVDQALMDELTRLKETWSPQEVLLVADAMLGQQSVDVATGFHAKVGLTGLILTKIDGDARGGAALSIREAVGVPIKFLGTGEKTDALEMFHPDRLASRILDLGDVLSLVEKAAEVVDQEKAQKAMERMAKNQFTMEDFLEQLHQMKKLGSMEGILKMLPGMGGMLKQMKNMAPPDQEMKKITAIIQSMTRNERSDHRILNGSRRARIAKGSGTAVSDVNRFVKQFEQTQKMMSQMMKLGLGKGGPLGGLGGLGGLRGPGKGPGRGGRFPF